MPSTKSQVQHKKSVHSAGEVARIASFAGKKVAPPDNVPLTAADLPFYDSVTAEMTTAEWSEHQCELAAVLAKLMHFLVREEKLLFEEGGSLKVGNGGVVKNPRKEVVGSIIYDITALRRTLGIHASVKIGPLPEKRRRNAMKVETKVLDTVRTRHATTLLARQA